MANHVKVLKLITGEEVIARVTESDIQITEGDGVDILILDQPMKITHNIINGDEKMGMMKWIKVAKSGPIDIETKFIIVILDPTPEIEKTYLSVVTGLTL